MTVVQITAIQGLGILFQYLGTGVVAGGAVAGVKDHKYWTLVIVGSIVAVIGIFMYYTIV